MFRWIRFVLVVACLFGLSLPGLLAAETSEAPGFLVDELISAEGPSALLAADVCDDDDDDDEDKDKKKKKMTMTTTTKTKMMMTTTKTKMMMTTKMMTKTMIDACFC